MRLVIAPDFLNGSLCIEQYVHVATTTEYVDGLSVYFPYEYA